MLAFSEKVAKFYFRCLDNTFPLFRKTERKDKVDDGHGGVIVYLKDSLLYKLWMDHEPRNIECILVEVIPSHSKHVLFGVFYRLPNTDAHYTTQTEHSLHLALDTNITDIIVTSDFNFNPNNATRARTLFSIYQQFNLKPFIDEPTNCTDIRFSFGSLFCTLLSLSYQFQCRGTCSRT